MLVYKLRSLFARQQWVLVKNSTCPESMWSVNVEKWSMEILECEAWEEGKGERVIWSKKMEYVKSKEKACNVESKGCGEERRGEESKEKEHRKR